MLVKVQHASDIISSKKPEIVVIETLEAQTNIYFLGASRKTGRSLIEKVSTSKNACLPIIRVFDVS